MARDRGGNVVILFSAAAPILALATGVGVDYSRAINARHSLQMLADRSALAGAQASRLGNATLGSVTAIVNNVVAAGAHGATINTATSMAANPASVTVKLDQDVAAQFSGIIGKSTFHVNVQATAKVSGGSPLCMASLATADPKLGSMPIPSHDSAGVLILAALALDVAFLPNPGLLMMKGSKTTAPGCIVSTNLAKPYSIASYTASMLTARTIQSGGGYVGTVGTNYSTTPTTDNPAAADPLGGLPPPPVGACNYTGMTVSGGTPTLTPGVYCGGLHITGVANVTLMPGVYVIKDGSLVVDNGSTVSGNGVGFYMTATGTPTSATRPNLYLGTDTHITLTAPMAGAMAGVLFFEDRSLPLGSLNAILSNDARTLLGTMYFSRGFLGIAATSPVADKSAYTIIVANALLLYGGPELVLNTDYSSPVPVPMGVGPNNGQVVLAQ